MCETVLPLSVWRCRGKFRVMVPAKANSPQLLSLPLDHREAQCVARSFRRHNVVADILPESRPLRNLAANAQERGVIVFAGLVGPICGCGCGQPVTHIVFPPSFAPGTHWTQALAGGLAMPPGAAPSTPAISEETPAMPQAPPASYLDFAKHLLAMICASLGIPKL